MTQTNLFGEYVKTRLGSWGHHFALHRDCEYLGHQSRNMLQVLIDHRGEMPPRATGYKIGFAHVEGALSAIARA